MASDEDRIVNTEETLDNEKVIYAAMKWLWSTYINLIVLKGGRLAEWSNTKHKRWCRSSSKSQTRTDINTPQESNSSR